MRELTLEGKAKTIPASEQFFRAISVDGHRKGLRLERVFWGLLEQAAHEQGITIAEILKLAGEEMLEPSSLSSFARTYAAKWSRKKIVDLRELASLSQVTKSISACPSPAFVISTDKKLKTYNAAFLRYIHRQIPVENQESAPKNLRLQLDIGTQELIAQLRLTNEPVLDVGFTVGYNDRRIRGRLNAVHAACWDEDLVTAYVVQ